MSRRPRAKSPYREREALRNIQRAGSPRAPWVDEPMAVHQVPTGVDLLALDGVGLAVADPGAVATFLCDHVGMHELDRTPERVLVGAGDRACTLALVAAEGSRATGVLRRLVLRVADVRRAVAALPAGTAVEGDQLELATFAGPDGLGLGFTMVAGGAIDYDVDHVRVRVSDPEQTTIALAEAGFVPRAQVLHVADKYVSLSGPRDLAQRPLLDHIRVRVASVDAIAVNARERGLVIEDSVGDETFGVVLPGPEQIRLRFVERTPPVQPRRVGPEGRTG